MERKQVGCEIESEIRFLALFGYHVISLGDDMGYQVLDQINIPIGSIHRVELPSAKENKQIPLFGYCIQVESKSIQYYAIREPYKEVEQYEFNLQDKSKTYVLLKLGEKPQITLWSKKCGYMDFRMDAHHMLLNCENQIDDLKIEHTISVKSFEDKKSYDYGISFCSSKKQMHSATDRTTSIVGFSQKENCLSGHILKWNGNSILKDTSFPIEGTALEAIQNHREGLYYFNQFRNVLNQLIPFQKEVFALLLEEVDIQDEMKVFVSDIARKKELSRKINR